jgi:predicted DNA binding CopG/RHH family protein
VGHIPHVQTLDKFKTAVMEFLKKPWSVLIIVEKKLIKQIKKKQGNFI